jgi:alanine-glyoxylate transaminase/serine-glyoxylate transaminase/serine-pyruvate transaminase
MTTSILERLQLIFRTSGPVILYPASGHGAWEAALVNTLSPGDRVLGLDNGHFASTWCDIATRLGFDLERVSIDGRQGVAPEVVEAALAQDRTHRIKAILAVHTETSTGVTSRIGELRKAMDRAQHPALLLVDAVTSLATTDYRHDDWGADVTVSASQKGLMLSPGLSFNAPSEKALRAAKKSKYPKGFWDWEPILSWNQRGFFPYTPATTLLFGLDESLRLLLDEGLEQVLARHGRWAEATRRAVRAWGLEVHCRNPEEYSNAITAVQLPEGHNADSLRQVILERFDMSLGKGLGQLEGKIFRIGHIGYFNDLMLAGTLSGVEMGLGLAGVPHQKGGVQVALEYLASQPYPNPSDRSDPSYPSY